MSLTPRQISAYLALNYKLDQFEQANALMVTALGAQGKGEDIKKVHKELSGG